MSAPRTRGGPGGALVLHGLTGSPQSVAGLAGALAAAGLKAEVPLLPGHGTSVDDLLGCRWDDWAGAAQAAFDRVASQGGPVVVAGLSMGGTLAVWLAARRPEVAGLVVVNPYIDPPATSFCELLRGIRDSGHDRLPAVGGDIADPSAREDAYDAMPVEPLLSLCEALGDVAARLGDVTCPTLLFSSRVDHVVPPVSGDVLAERVSGPLERVWLDRSFHVATLDHDRDLIERRTAAFVTSLFPGSRPRTGA